MKPENRIIIVDEKEFDRIDKLAKLKEKAVERLAHKKYLKYIKKNGIQMKLSINGVENVIRQQVLTELNYDERGYPESVQEEVKHAIVDDITHYVNKHFEHYKEDCETLVKGHCKQCKFSHNKKAMLWMYLFIITFILLIGEFIFRFILK